MFKMSIKKLPHDVRQRVQSSCQISDATQCVLELVYNSLDAKATSIAVRLNIKSFFIQVVDNGSGVSSKDLPLIVKRFTTCKCYNLTDLEQILPTFGYKGSSLASILNISKAMEIQSKHEEASDTYQLIIKNNSPQELTICKQRPSRGTTVTVHEFFYNLPVRRKRLNEIFDVDDVKQAIEAIAITNPQVSFSLRNDLSGQVLLQTHKQPTALSLSDMFSSTNGCSKSLLIDIHCTQEPYTVNGFISRVLHTDSTLQLLYVNGRYIQKSRVHKLVIDMMARYGKSLFSQDLPEILPDCFVFVVKVQCPYILCHYRKHGKKFSVEFSNNEAALKTVYRSIKSALKRNEIICIPSESSYQMINCDTTYQPPDKKKRMSNGNPEFGASQLTHAVRGKTVGRKRNAFDNSLLDTKTVVIKEYKKQFFENSTLEGTGLNPPIFDLGDFPQVSFHEFLAWLHVKSLNDSIADKLLKEFLAFKSSQIRLNLNDSVPICKPRQILSIKEVRREKYNMMKSFKTNNVDEKEHTATISNICHESSPSICTWKSHYREEKETSAMIVTPFRRNQTQPVFENDAIKTLHSPKMSQINNVVNEKLNDGYASISFKQKHIMEITPAQKNCSPGVNSPGSPIFKTVGMQTSIKSMNHVMVQVSSSPKKLQNLETQTHTLTYKDVSIQYNGNLSNSFERSDIYQHFLQQISSEKSSAPKSNAKNSQGQRSSLADTVPATATLPESCLEIEWSEVNPGSSAPFFVNTVSGFTTFDPPVCSTRNVEFLKEDSIEVSKPTESQEECLKKILQDLTSPPVVPNHKWMEGNGEKSQLPQSVLADLQMKTRENKDHFEKRIQTTALTKPLAAVNKLVASFQFTRESLINSCQVVGQVDKKFIAAKLKYTGNDNDPILCLFDQHAVHERILLESLLKVNIADNKVTSKIVKSSLKLSTDQLITEVVISYKEHFVNNGLDIEVLNHGELLVNSVPNCFIDKEESSIKGLVLNLIQEIVDHLKDTNGTTLTNPKTIMDVLSSKACRGAVKFNQILSFDEMVDLMDQLKTCQMPFQCAHGRPTAVPLLCLSQ